jgi:uncharacterized membrane protein
METKQKSNLLIQITKFFTPVILGLGVIVFVGFLMQENLRLRFWPLITTYFFPPLGKESVIPTGVGLGINPLVMALSIAFVDIIVALFLLWNYDPAKKIPLVGKFMIKVENIGKSSSDKYSWIKPLRFIGIILFVMVPFQGSGGLVGSIIGRLIGMKPWNTFFAITIGAVVGTIFIAYFSEAILSVFVKNFLLGILIIIIIVVIGFMILIYKRSKNYNKTR